MYTRYRIEAKEAPPAFHKPNKFSVTVHKTKFVPMIMKDLSMAKNAPELLQTIKSRPCIYGVYGRVVGGLAPIEEKCRGCFRCVLENPGVVDISLNKEFKATGDSYFRPSLVSTIWDEASNGKIPIKGAGYKGKFAGPGFDGMWTDFSEIVRPTRDGIHGREFISTEVPIGRVKTRIEKVSLENDLVSIPIPIVFDVPKGIDYHVFTEAAKRTGTFAVTHVKKTSKYEQGVIPRLGWKDIMEVDEKYEVVEVETDSLESYRKAKEHLKGRVVIARVLATGDLEFIGKLAKVADSIHLIHDFHGFEFSENPKFIIESLKTVHEKLVEMKIRDELSIIAGGGIAAAEHIPKTILCGADLVSIDIAALVALQAEFNGECTDKIPSLGRIKHEWGSQRLVNLLAAWRDQLLEIMGAMGMRETRRLRGELGRAMFYADLEKEVFEPIFGNRKETHEKRASLVAEATR